MSLRNKIVILLAAVILLYAIVDHSVQRMTISRSFVQLENDEATTDATRVVEAIYEKIETLHRLCEQWAQWEATHAFVSKGGSDFLVNDLDADTLERLDLNLLYLCDPGGRVVWSDIGFVDPESGRFQRTLRDFPGKQLTLSHPLLPKAIAATGSDYDLQTDEFSGILLTEGGPMLASSHQVVGADPERGSAGTLIMGRFLASDMRETIENQTQVAFDLWSLDGDQLPPEAQELLDRVTASTVPVLDRSSDVTMHAYTTVRDIRRGPGLLIRAKIPREISARGATSVRYALISTLVSGFVMLLVLVKLIENTVLAPIAKLTNHAVEIGKSEDFSAKIDLKRDDEIGVLSREFDQMLEKLEEAQAAIVTTARKAGMSEIATGILHNVGNVLNSVNVSATLISQKVRDSSVSDLEKLSVVLSEHADNLSEFVESDRGKHFQPYLNALAEQLGSEQKAVSTELQAMIQGVDHIRELIDSQQAYAGMSGVMESTDLNALIEQALELSNRASAADDRLKITRDCEDIPRVPMDKHKLLEILVNLIQNARQSMEEAQLLERELTLTMRHSEGHVTIEVGDNGLGIPGENLMKVFNHGFTTKAEGHGFGLHAAANAATEMHGALSARSEGLGHGATFVVELPIELPVAVEAQS